MCSDIACGIVCMPLTPFWFTIGRKILLAVPPQLLTRIWNWSREFVAIGFVTVSVVLMSVDNRGSHHSHVRLELKVLPVFVQKTILRAST